MRTKDRENPRHETAKLCDLIDAVEVSPEELDRS